MLTPTDILGNLRTFGIRKDERFDEPLIDDFIRSQKCAICGEHPPSTVSHCIGKGRAGNNASSIFKMPKCLRCHQDWESLSVEEFERKHAVNMRNLTILWAEKIVAYLCERLRELTGEQKASPRAKKVAQKAKSDFATRCSKLTDEEFHQAGIWLQETMKRIREGRIGKVEMRKLKEYLK